MKDQVYINDKDISITYGAKLIGSSYLNLLTRPEYKEGVENDVSSQPGVQKLTTKKQPQARNIELEFLLEAKDFETYLKNFDALQNAIDNESANNQFTLKVTVLKTVYKLERISYLPLDSIKTNSGKLIVNVREINPKDRGTL